MEKSIEGSSQSLAGLRIAIAEDEPILAFMLEDILSNLGCTVLGSAGTLSDAIALANSANADIAVLDVNLKEHRVDAAADTFLSRGAGLVFASGYGQDGVSTHLRSWPVISKPFAEEDLLAAILAALNIRGR